MVELLDALLQLRDLAAQRADFRNQLCRRRVDVGHLVRHCPEPLLLSAAPVIARFQSPENTGTWPRRLRRKIAATKRRLPSPNRPPKRAGSNQLVQGGTMAEPLVGIIMGSSSDWETMRHAAETLDAARRRRTRRRSSRRTGRPSGSTNMPTRPRSAGSRWSSPAPAARRTARHDGIDDRASGARRAGRKQGAEGHG